MAIINQNKMPKTPYKKDAIIYAANDRSDSVYLVHTGSVQIETKNGKVKVLGPGAIHDKFIPEVNKMPELDEHGKKIRTEFSS